MPFPALLADLVLVAHLGVVLFVVCGQALIVAGGVRGWRWIRGLPFRAGHLALVVFIAGQAWLGQVCPLTGWEQQLRRAAGQAAHAETFVEHWLSRLLFFQAPWWVFVAAYTLFAALVVASWRRWPPRRRREGAGGRG